jgi:hypothetical protein
MKFCAKSGKRNAAIFCSLVNLFFAISRTSRIKICLRALCSITFDESNLRMRERRADLCVFAVVTQRRRIMKKLVLGVVATGALVAAAAAPAMAQVGVYAGPGGVGVGVGPFGVGVGPAYYGGPYYDAPYSGYYDYAPGPAPGWHGRWHHHHYHR